MSWNNRVQVQKYTHADGTEEFTATVHEVFYDAIKGVGGTDAISPQGEGNTSIEAVQSLKLELQLMLEAVDFVLEGKTSIYDHDVVSTRDPGAKSEIIQSQKSDVLDRDDDFMDERYGDNDDETTVVPPNLLSALDVIERSDTYISTEPEIIIDRDGSKVSKKTNIPGDFYSDEFDVYVYERYAQVKFRDSTGKVEYQLVMKPWNMSVSLNIWNDDPKAESCIIKMVDTKFIEPTEELSEVVLQKAKDLMYKMYKYYEITPCAQEK